jgi:hypothetical protein
MDYQSIKLKSVAKMIGNTYCYSSICTVPIGICFAPSGICSKSISFVTKALGGDTFPLGGDYFPLRKDTFPIGFFRGRGRIEQRKTKALQSPFQPSLRGFMDLT